MSEVQQNTTVAAIRKLIREARLSRTPSNDPTFDADEEAAYILVQNCLDDPDPDVVKRFGWLMESGTLGLRTEDGRRTLSQLKHFVAHEGAEGFLRELASAEGVARDPAK